MISNYCIDLVFYINSDFQPFKNALKFVSGCIGKVVDNVIMIMSNLNVVVCH